MAYAPRISRIGLGVLALATLALAVAIFVFCSVREESLTPSEERLSNQPAAQLPSGPAAPLSITTQATEMPALQRPGPPDPEAERLARRSAESAAEAAA